MEMACPRCGRQTAVGAIACSYCGQRLSIKTKQGGKLKCTRCGRQFSPSSGIIGGESVCEVCRPSYQADVARARESEERRKTLHVSQIIAKHPELRQKIMQRIGVSEFDDRFYVDYAIHEEICNWDQCMTQAKNYEVAKRHEDAAKLYESIGLWKLAGDAREKKSSTTVRQVSVNLNELISQLRAGGLNLPYKCSGCGATITVGKDTNPEALKFCSYCGSAMNIEMLANMLRDALK